jgi:hypothetical protein
MANVKNIHIGGKLPFDCAKHHDLCRFLGQLNAPTFGLRVTWGDASTHEYRKNAWGGKTCFVPFDIAGEEAVGDDWATRLVAAIVNAGGDVKGASIRDVENNTRATCVPVPAPVRGEFVAEFRVTVTNPELLDDAEPAWTVAAAIGPHLKPKLDQSFRSVLGVTLSDKPAAIAPA